MSGAIVRSEVAEENGEAPVYEKADTAAWLAVAAGSLGAMMATLDVSIVNSALPTIQGEIGASGTEGTWVATAYIVAEIIIIPLSAWLQRLLGLRTMLLIAVSLFTGFSVVCGSADNLTTMIIGRVGQGFTGGALIPTAMSIVATRLPKPQQPIGSALFGLTAILGPVLGPLLGGWLTEQFSWHYAFFLNVPIGILLTTLLILGLPHQPVAKGEILKADWLGIVGLALALGGLTIVLEEGQREQWFESVLIVWLTFLALIGLAMLLAGQRYASRPVIKLSLLLDRQFGAVAFMGFVLGMVIFGTSFAIPQFLSAIAGYDSLQSGYVVVLSGIPALLMMPLVPRMIRTIDIRVAIISGLLILAVACWLNVHLTANSDGGAFTYEQLMRGVGTILCFLFLNQAAISSVPTTLAADAAGLFAASRNLGGSIVLAAIATIQDQRLTFHSRQIEESLSVNPDLVQEHLSSLSDVVGDPGAALRMLADTIAQQALVMTFNDLFFLLTIGIVVIIPLPLLLRPLPRGVKLGTMH